MGLVLMWYNDVNMTIVDSNKTLLSDILLLLITLTCVNSLAYMATLALIISILVFLIPSPWKIGLYVVILTCFLLNTLPVLNYKTI